MLGNSPFLAKVGNQFEAAATERSSPASGSQKYANELKDDEWMEWMGVLAEKATEPFFNCTHAGERVGEQYLGSILKLFGN